MLYSAVTEGDDFFLLEADVSILSTSKAGEAKLCLVG